MSRIGKLPVPVPAGVDVTVEQSTVTVKGPKGVLSHSVASPITVEHGEGGQLRFVFLFAGRFGHIAVSHQQRVRIAGLFPVFLQRVVVQLLQHGQLVVGQRLIHGGFITPTDTRRYIFAALLLHVPRQRHGCFHIHGIIERYQRL